MIPRYTRPEMAKIWEPENRFRIWLEIETLACEAQITLDVDTPEALERLVETYLALGIPQEAWKSAAVLGKNYPETYWYRQSLRLLLKGRKLEERVASLPNGGRVASYPAGEAAPDAPARPKATAYPDLIKPPIQ